MFQPGLNSDVRRSQIFHRDNIEELINNYIQFERRKEQDQNNNAHEFCYATKFKKSSSYTYGMNHHDNSFMKETTMENTKQELAEDYVELAKSYISEKNYDKAEKFLLKAKQLSPAKKIDETLAKLTSLSKGSNRRKVRSSLFNNTHEEFDRLLNMTDKHLHKKNLKKAEEFLMKAKELNHNEKVEIRSMRLHYLKRQASNEEYLNISKNANKDESEKCVTMAKQLIEIQDYEKAEKLLLKAKKLYPDKETDSLLAKLYSRYNQDKVSREKGINADEAERCVQLAEEYIEKKSYEKAKKFLLKAKRLCPSVFIDDSMTRLERLISQQRNEDSNHFTKEEVNKAEAEKCIQTARSYIDQSNFNKAEELIKKAKNLDPELNVEDLLQEVTNLKQRRKSESYFFRIDMNKEEAERCIEMATYCMNQKNFDKARKFLMKAKKLYPMLTIDETLNELELMSKTTNTSKKSNLGPNQKNYTKEQEEVINRILSCGAKDYYEIMQVPLGVDLEEVKKAYKKLAMKVHPDKNYAPGAEEAFKKLNRANEVLSTIPKKNAAQQDFSKKKENHNQNESSFRENFFNESYQDSSFNQSSNWRPRFNTSFEDKPRPRDNYSNHYRQESNNFDFEHEEPFLGRNFQYDFFNSTVPNVDPTPGYSKKQLVVLTVLSTILAIFVGRYLFFNKSLHTSNYPEPTLNAEDLVASLQPNNLNTSEASDSYSLMRYLTEIEYRKHLATVYSGIASCSVKTYNVLSEIKWKEHTEGFVSFFYENTKSMIVVTKNCIFTVGQFSYPYISIAYSKSTEFCSSAYNSLVDYDWLTAWNKTKDISVSLVPWETLGRIKDGTIDLAVRSYRSLFGPSVTETPQSTMGWIKNGCVSLASSSYRSVVGCNWSNLWGTSNSSSSEVSQSTIEWIKSGCINFGAKSYNFFAGYDWVYFWNKSKDLCGAWMPWSTYEWLRNNFLNSSFALTCLKTGIRATASSITYISQSIYSLVKDK